MQEVKLGEGMTLKVYSSIKELPIRVTKEMNKYLIQDAGLGADIESVDAHLAQLLLFIGHGKNAEAMEEAKNMRLGIFSALSKLDFRSLSMACMIQSVNGIPVTDYTEDGLRNLIEQIGDYPSSELESVIDQVKKNLIPSG